VLNSIFKYCNPLIIFFNDGRFDGGDIFISGVYFVVGSLIFEVVVIFEGECEVYLVKFNDSALILAEAVGVI